jgi:hypothetical protein
VHPAVPSPTPQTRRATGSILLATLLFFGAWSAQPQATSPSTALLGLVRDPAGYLVPQARITLTPIPPTTTLTTKTDGAGLFRFNRLSPGHYILTVQADGFSDLEQTITITESTTHIDLTLRIPPTEIKLEVPADQSDPTNPEHNGSAIILHPADLQTLADDPDTMLQQIQAIAGPTPDGSRLYVDGFDATRLPPKSDIREIRINSNLYSAQYDSPGQGRIEVFTRAGSGTLHGALFFSEGNSALNAQDPIAPQPPYSNTRINGYLNGPITKHLSADVNLYQAIHNESVIVDAILPTGPFVQAVPNPATSTYFTLRLDFKPLPATSLSIRFNLQRDTQNSAGVGGLSLASQAYRLQNTTQILQLLATTTLNAKTVNELRFQYTRNRDNQFAQSSAPTLSVEGAFVDGGAANGTNRDNQDLYDLQDYLSHVFKKSFLRSGIRLRITRDANSSTSGFNGQFTFPSLAAYQAGAPTLYSITTGNPSIAVARVDAAAYAEDDWKPNPRLTGSLGIRFEAQNVIADHHDFGPRVALAYSLGDIGPKAKHPPFVLRAGSGIFYQRFSTTSQLNAARHNGILEHQYQVTDPTYPAPTALGPAATTAIWQLGPTLRTPYDVYSGAALDHNFGHTASVSVNYSNIHLTHAFETRNVNAPLPGTYNPAIPTSGVRPIPTAGNIYQYGSEGVSGQNALRLTGSYRKSIFSMYSFYSYAFNTSNTNGGFPSNSYNQHADYGRSANDLRHQLYLYLNLTLPGQIQTSTNLLVHAGAPFNITLGEDLNGDTQYNDRPTYATDLTRASVVQTPWGAFDTRPLPGQTTIPINLGTSPVTFQVDERIARTIPFGPRLPPSPSAPHQPKPAKPQLPPRRFAINFNLYVINILNHPNYTTPNGTLGSPLFGHPTADQGARSLNFGAYFSF